MWKQIKALRVLWPRRMSWRKTLLACTMIGLIVGAFASGRFLAPATAQAPDNIKLIQANPNQLIMMQGGGDPRGRVATIYGNVPISRQDLGEYLIARLGSERLEFLINRKIIEYMCLDKGITVSDAEIEAQLIDDLKLMKVINLDQFVNTILKKFGKTLYEYKEDVVRPKIAMRKLCAEKVRVTDQDVSDAFEAKYGAKVQCRIIVFDKNINLDRKNKVWADLKDDKDGSKFKKYAKEINPPELGAHGGEVPPIHKHFASPTIEKEAFSLHEGEISSLLEMPDGSTVILKCDAKVPPETDHRPDDERNELQHEVYDRKMAEAVPNTFKALRDQAKPMVFLPREEANPAAAKRINAALIAAAEAAAKAQADTKMPPVPAGITINP